MAGLEERENKYDVDDAVELPPLDLLPGVVSVRSSRTVRLDATYFDTAGFDLAGAGVTVRRRTGGPDEGWHLKLPTPQSRHEVQLPLGRATRTVPATLRKAVQAAVRDRSMSPVAKVHTRRREHRLLGADRQVLAVVAEDRVEADADGRSQTWREWEVELVDGDESLLEAADELLCGAGANPSPATSKLARVLDVPGPDERTRDLARPTRDGPASYVARLRLAQQVAALRLWDPLVRCDADDAVHKMRVAVRRLRTALATYRKVLDRRSTDPLREELAWLGDALGDARDAEVLRERLHGGLVEVAQAPVVARADRIVRERYGEMHRQAVGAMESDRYFTLLDRLDGLLAEPPWRENASESVDEVLLRRIRHEWRRVADRVDALPEPGAEGRAEGLHAVRRAVKRMRYAVEPMTGLYGKQARKLVKMLEREQTLLGEHHDSLMAQEMSRQLADSLGDGFAFGRLYERELGVTDRTDQEFAETWARVSRKKLRRWLR
jgi:CHAD domain-containing protein